MCNVLLNVIYRKFIRINFYTILMASIFTTIIFTTSLHAESGLEEPYIVMDSFGQHYFYEPPKRVIVTDWTLLEQLLILEIIPVGAPEIENYKPYSAFLLPESIQDIGLRQSPSPNIMAELEPDLIILGTDQKHLARPLSRISKVLYYQNFSPRFKNNGSTIIKRLKQIANIFLKQDVFVLIQKDIEILSIEHNKKIAGFFSANKPSVIAIRIFSNGEMIAYSPHSLVGWVIGKLGLNNVIENKKTKFGEQRLSSEKIKNNHADYVLCFGTCTADFLAEKIENKKIIRLTEHWPYGGVPTIQSLIQEISNKLITP